MRTTKVVVPAGETGVLLNVTGVQPTGTGWIAVRPGDATGAPSTSSINLVPGDILPNSVTVAVPTAGGNAGQIDITYGSAPGNTVNVIDDIVGYATSAGLVDLVNRVVALESSGGAGDLAAHRTTRRSRNQDRRIRHFTPGPIADKELGYQSRGGPGAT